MLRCERAVCNGAGSMDCSAEGIRDELILLVVGSTSELGTDDYLDVTSPSCSFAISNIFKRRCYYQRTYPEQREIRDWKVDRQFDR
jgi:hypothetical protein